LDVKQTATIENSSQRKIAQISICKNLDGYYLVLVSPKEIILQRRNLFGTGKKEFKIPNMGKKKKRVSFI